MATGTVVIYGASDDLIEIEGDVPGCDEYGCSMATEMETFVLVGVDGQARIRVRYTERGVWAIEVAPVDEGGDGLPVSIEISGYTARATIEGVRSVIHEATA